MRGAPADDDKGPGAELPLAVAGAVTRSDAARGEDVGADG